MSPRTARIFLAGVIVGICLAGLWITQSPACSGPNQPRVCAW